MKMRVLGSSSSGNCYLLTAKTGETLVLEAGLPFNEIKKGLNFSLATVSGCVVSHLHGDHSKAVAKMLDNGIKVYAHESVFESIGKSAHSFAYSLIPRRAVKVGTFEVCPLEVMHDVPCYAYIITHSECGKILFVTDTTSFNYELSFPINQLMIELNYDADTIRHNVETGVITEYLRKRVVHSHMEKSMTRAVIKRLQSSAMENICLVHLSSHNLSDVSQEVMKWTDIPTYIAEEGLEIDFDKH